MANALEEEWECIPMETARNLIFSILLKLEALIVFGEGNTWY